MEKAAELSVTQGMGGDPPFPVRMGVTHSMTLNIVSEAQLPVRIGAKYSVTFFPEITLSS